MSLIKAEKWLPILSFYELTSLITALSIVGVDLHTTWGLRGEPDDTFASNKPCPPILALPVFFFFLFSPRSCARIRVDRLRPQIPEQPRYVRSGRRWSSCSPCVARALRLLGASGRRGPRAGIRSVSEAKGCGDDVITLEGSIRSLTHKLLETSRVRR